MHIGRKTYLFGFRPLALIILALVGAAFAAQFYLQQARAGGGSIYILDGAGGTFAASGTINAAYNAGSGPGRVLVAVIGIDHATRKVNTLSYGGQSMTEAAYKVAGFFGTDDTAVQIFYLVDPPAGSNSLVATVSASDQYTYSVGTVYGAGADPIGVTVPTSAGQSTSLSINKTTEGDESIIVAGLVSDSSTALTPSGGSTEFWDQGYTGSTVRTGMYYKTAVGMGGNVTVSATGANVSWGSVAIEIMAGAASLPIVGVQVIDDEATEGAGEGEAGSDTATIRFSRSSDDGYDNDLEINFSNNDSSAYYGNDYSYDLQASTCDNVTGDSVVISNEATYCDLVIVAEGDEDEEDTETVDIELNNSEDYEISEDGERGVTAYIINYTPAASGDYYLIEPPGFATMSIYDEDTLPAGNVTGFSASPARVKAGESATLSWTISGMTSCSIDQGIGAVTFSDGTHASTTPAISTRKVFTLTCTDGSGGPAHVWSATVGIIPTFIEQ